MWKKCINIKVIKYNVYLIKKKFKKNIVCKVDFNIIKILDKSYNLYIFYFYFKFYVIKFRYYDV